MSDFCTSFNKFISLIIKMCSRENGVCSTLHTLATNYRLPLRMLFTRITYSLALCECLFQYFNFLSFRFNTVLLIHTHKMQTKLQKKYKEQNWIKKEKKTTQELRSFNTNIFNNNNQENSMARWTLNQSN